MAEQVSQDVNDLLRQISREVYEGSNIELRVVDPKGIRLLQKNARYMSKATFDQLTHNVRGDGFLSSVPLCHTLPDGSLECVSGNHRVQSAIAADIERLVVIVILETLDESRKVAIQLSHNALVGQDDQQLLAELYAEITDLEHQLYSGIDAAEIDALPQVDFQAFNAEPVRTEKVVLWFVPEEVNEIETLLGEAAEFARADTVYLAPMEKYEEIFRALADTKKFKNIKNTAVAFLLLANELSGVVANWKKPTNEEKPVENQKSQAAPRKKRARKAQS